MGHWNYRMMKKDTEDGVVEFYIVEAYFDEGKEPHSYTVGAMSPYGETEKELKEDLEHMMLALGKPVLTPEDFPIATSVDAVFKEQHPSS